MAPPLVLITFTAYPYFRIGGPIACSLHPLPFRTGKENMTLGAITLSIVCLGCIACLQCRVILPIGKVNRTNLTWAFLLFGLLYSHRSGLYIINLQYNKKRSITYKTIMRLMD